MNDNTVQTTRRIGWLMFIAGLLAIAAVFEEMTGLAKLLPIDPRPGEVPPF